GQPRHQGGGRGPAPLPHPHPTDHAQQGADRAARMGARRGLRADLVLLRARPGWPPVWRLRLLSAARPGLRRGAAPGSGRRRVGAPDPLPRERTWLLPALHAIQHAGRWISSEDLVAVAEHLRVPLSEVYGVATHYPEFRLTEPGRRGARARVEVSCRILGSLDLLAALERRLGVAAGATTADGAWTLEAFDCAF